jgi:hypothetical protein
MPEADGDGATEFSNHYFEKVPTEYTKYTEGLRGPRRIRDPTRRIKWFEENGSSRCGRGSKFGLSKDHG